MTGRGKIDFITQAMAASGLTLPKTGLPCPIMTESLASITWQETVDLAVTRLEEKTGLSLSGLSQCEISIRVREWMKAKAEGRLESMNASQVI
jgi:hypothetical protein